MGETAPVPLALPSGEARVLPAGRGTPLRLFLEDRVLLLGEDGRFRETRELPWPRPEAFVLCDWDGDGGTDVLSARPFLHWWRGRKGGLFPLSDQGALLTSRGETLAAPRPWDRSVAALDADGDGRTDLILGGPEGLRIRLQEEEGRVGPSRLLTGPGGGPFRLSRPSSLAAFRGPEGRALLALFRGDPPVLEIYTLERKREEFHLAKVSSWAGPLPGLTLRPGGPGPLAAWKEREGGTFLLAGPAPRILEILPGGKIRPRNGFPLEETSLLRLPGQAYPALIRRRGRTALAAGPGFFRFSGNPPPSPPGPPRFLPLDCLPLGPWREGVLALERGGRLLLVRSTGKASPLPSAPSLLSSSRPALGDLDGDGIQDLAGFPGGGGHLTFWKGLPGGRFAGGKTLEAAPEVLASLPMVLAGSGPGLVLSTLSSREDFFAQVEVKRPGPGPWRPGLLLRFRDAENLLLLQASIPREREPLVYELTLVELLEGERRVLARKTLGFPDGEWHTLAASVVGDRVRAWWDGSYLGGARTALPGPGPAGLFAGKGRVHFRSFKILPPPGSLPAGRRGKPWKDTLLGKRKVLGGSWHLARDIPEPPGGILFARPEGAGPGPALYAADWDQDGDLDLLVGRRGFPLMWLEQVKPLAFRPPRPVRLATGRPLHEGPLLDAPAAAHLDGDGRIDLLVGDGLGRIHWYPGKALLLPPQPREGR